jgi:hypothetical protein
VILQKKGGDKLYLKKSIIFGEREEMEELHTRLKKYL